MSRLAERYVIERPLGRGGMGSVVVATDRRTGSPVALKRLGDAWFTPGERELSRFEQEARIAGSLDSPHIARVFDAGQDPESHAPFLVMELLAGEDLQALLDRVGPLAVDAAVRVAAQAALGLAAAHEAGVIHRDVKPGNLFLSRAPGGVITVKLLDFGIAKIRRPAPGAPGASGVLPAPSVSVTRSGEMLGSPLFMAPEQVEASRHVDARADVFSLGVVLYAMITGRAPFAHIKSFVQLLYTLVNTPAPPLAAAAPWAPPALAAVVDRAMSHDPEGRYPDARAMLAALRGCLSGDVVLGEDSLVGSGERAAAPAGGAEPGARAATAQDPPPRVSLWRRILG